MKRLKRVRWTVQDIKEWMDIVLYGFQEQIMLVFPLNLEL